MKSNVSRLFTLGSLALTTLSLGCEGEPTCERLSFPVLLEEGDEDHHEVVGWLCGEGTLKHRTIHVLLHGATYSHSYWDPDYRPEQYSSVRALAAAGFGVLNLDRIGVGESARPEASRVTIESNAYVVHQIVTALRSGQLSTDSFGQVQASRVVLVGHSFGSAVAALTAATYQDVEGVILTGFLHSTGPDAAGLISSFIPAELDPRFADANLPSGYVTTVAGSRGAPYFYASGSSEPELIELDELTKETATIPELTNPGPGYGATPQIRVPVLLAVGDLDTLFCPLPSCSESGTLEAEAAFYSEEACLQTLSFPGVAHNLNGHLQAPLFHRQAIKWSIERVGVSSTRPPLRPCRT